MFFETTFWYNPRSYQLKNKTFRKFTHRLWLLIVSRLFFTIVSIFIRDYFVREYFAIWENFVWDCFVRTRCEIDFNLQGNLLTANYFELGLRQL